MEPWKLEDPYGFSVPTSGMRQVAGVGCVQPLLSLPFEIDVNLIVNPLAPTYHENSFNTQVPRLLIYLRMHAKEILIFYMVIHQPDHICWSTHSDPSPYANERKELQVISKIQHYVSCLGIVFFNTAEKQVSLYFYNSKNNLVKFESEWTFIRQFFQQILTILFLKNFYIFFNAKLRLSSNYSSLL